MNERILALDIGSARIGVAVSDATRTIATPVEVIHSVGWGPDIRRVTELCDRYDTREILSGLPLNMDGTEGFQAEKVKQFCKQLEKKGFTVYYQDERLTTVTAEDALLEDNMSREGRKKVVDKVAAAIILQQWLDSEAERRNNMENNQEELNEMNMDEEDGIIEMIDEDDKVVRFEMMGRFEYDGTDYLALVPADEGDEDTDEIEVVFMEVCLDDNEEEIYELVEDEELNDALLAELTELMDAEDEGGND